MTSPPHVDTAPGVPGRHREAEAKEADRRVPINGTGSIPSPVAQGRGRRAGAGSRARPFEQV